MFLFSLTQTLLLIVILILVILIYVRVLKKSSSERYIGNCFGAQHDGQDYMEKPNEPIATYGLKSKWPHGGTVISPAGEVQRLYMAGAYEAAV